jgi:hypothetical protein
MQNPQSSTSLDNQDLIGQPVLPVDFFAGPAKPNISTPIALSIVFASFLAPILFLSAGAASPLLGISVIALAAAGIITVFGAVNARQRTRNDPHVRMRARIGAEGITLYAAPAPAPGQFFPAGQITNARLFKNSLVVLTTDSHPAPGRHAVRFGKAVNRHEDITAALAAISQSP